MKTTALLLSLAATLAFAAPALACDRDKGMTTASTEAAPAAEAQLVTLTVSDATCGSCVVPIRQTLTAMKGVLKVEGSEADFKDILVTVTRGQVSDDALIAAVKEAGYTATVKAPAAAATTGEDKKNS